jgi:hypothetical protein
MKTKAQINEASQLVGMFVGNGKSNTLTEAQLQNIATSLGYRTAQIRDNYSMYDCMYDTSRLQIHVDEQNQITSVRIG